MTRNDHMREVLEQTKEVHDQGGDPTLATLMDIATSLRVLAEAVETDREWGGRS